VVEPLGPVSTDPLLAERGVSQRVPERGTALVDDLFAVSNKQKAAPRKLSSQTGIVDRRNHRLPGPGGGNKQVPMMTLVAGEGVMCSSSASWNGRSSTSTGLSSVTSLVAGT